MRIKSFLFSLLFFLFFWWGINVLAFRIEKNPDFLQANLIQGLEKSNFYKLSEEKTLKENLNSLDIKAKAVACVEIGNTGEPKILFSKNYNLIIPIASLSKLMTALVVFDLNETYNLNQKIREDVSIGELVYKMLIESNNDAALSLAGFIGEKPFVDLMNIYAKKIGLNNTYFVNPTGLDINGSSNLSTAEDLVKLSAYILQNYPQIFEITKNQEGNTNELLIDYPEIIGGKTGETSLAGGCLIEIIKKPDSQNRYIAVILGTQDRFSEMHKIIQVIR